MDLPIVLLCELCFGDIHSFIVNYILFILYKLLYEYENLRIVPGTQPQLLMKLVRAPNWSRTVLVTSDHVSDGGMQCNPKPGPTEKERGDLCPAVEHDRLMKKILRYYNEIQMGLRKSIFYPGCHCNKKYKITGKIFFLY